MRTGSVLIDAWKLKEMSNLTALSFMQLVFVMSTRQLDVKGRVSKL